MTPMLISMFASPGGPEALDVLMKYLYGAYNPTGFFQTQID